MTKYHAKRSGGFASKKEHRVIADLQLQEKLGLIKNLRLQVSFELTPKVGKERSSQYIADAVFEENGKEVVLDAKGFRTPLYILKRKVLRMRYGIEIREV